MLGGTILPGCGGPGGRAIGMMRHATTVAARRGSVIGASTEQAVGQVT